MTSHILFFIMSIKFLSDFVYNADVDSFFSEINEENSCQIERFFLTGIVECSICVVHSKREFFCTIE